MPGTYSTHVSFLPPTVIADPVTRWPIDSGRQDNLVPARSRATLGAPSASDCLSATEGKETTKGKKGRDGGAVAAPSRPAGSYVDVDASFHIEKGEGS